MDPKREPETELPPPPGTPRPSSDARTFESEPGRGSGARGGAAGATIRGGGAGSEIPDRIGAYKVLGKIGEGGMGYVLLASRDDGQFRQRVAIKLIKRGMDTDQVLKRFEVERQVLGALNHPNIARLYDAGATTDGRPYFVIEYVEGESIDEYCDSQQLSIPARLELFRKVCSAIQYAHQNLIVHRDIKPGNILVNSQGEPKLLDFGIAKVLSPDMTGAEVATMVDMRLMTPEYASPEQVQGKPITTATDVYSLGVLLYELLTGHPPYHLRTRMRDEIERVICHVEPERPSTAITRNAEVATESGETRTLTAEEVAKFRDVTPVKAKRRLSGDLDNIVLMALRKTPRRRYSSVEQFSEDIRRHMTGLPVIARPETWGYVFSKFVERNRVGVAAAAAVFLALSGGVASTSYMAHLESVARGREAEQRRLAEQRTDQLRLLCREFLTDLFSQLDRLDGSSQARVALASASTAVLAELRSQATASERDPVLIADLALGFERAGEAMRDSSERDTTERAVAALESAVELRRSLADAPASARSRVHLASALLAANKPTEARALLDEVVAEARASSGSAWGGVLAGALEARSWVNRHDARNDEAFDDANEAVEAREGSGESSEALADALVARALLRNQRESFDLALADITRARDLYATLSQQPPGQRLASLRLEARIRMNLGELEAARLRFDEARNLAEARYAVDPLSPRIFDELARVYEEYGDLEYESGDFGRAGTLYAAYRERADAALAKDPLSFSRARAASLAREKVADARQQTEGFTPGVLALYDEAVKGYEGLLTTSTDAQRIREDIARASLSGAYVLDMMNTDEPGAFERYRAAHEGYRALGGVARLSGSDRTRFTLALRNAGFLALKLDLSETGERFLSDAIEAAPSDDPKMYKLWFALAHAQSNQDKTELARASARRSWESIVASADVPDAEVAGVRDLMGTLGIKPE